MENYKYKTKIVFKRITIELRYGVEEALQWWYHKKLGQLESEANLIREQLLQESFALRRSLELSSIKSNLIRLFLSTFD